VKKGSRVKFKSGAKAGVTGTIFWTGKDKYKGGERYGVTGDDGQTHWANSSEVEASDAPEPDADAGEQFDKGDRVRFRDRGNTGTGTVFWTGDSRRGGQRIGIRDDHDPDNAVWLDARAAERLSEEEDQGAPDQSGRGRDAGRSTAPSAAGGWAEDGPDFDNTAEAMQGMGDGQVPDPPPDMPGPAPMDDSYLDGLAATIDDDVPF
jgi:hypothetical protein